MEHEYTLIEIPEKKTTAEELERELSFILPPLFQTIDSLRTKVGELEKKLLNKNKTNKKRTTF